MHHSLRKMFQYCGPLPIDEICSGLRHSVSRTNFPVPPPEVMKKILLTSGYIESKDRYSWGGEFCEDLNSGEITIINCLNQKGKIISHSELAQSFIESEYSFPLLHRTLYLSPLFKKIETGLYKLRGIEVTSEEIHRAKEDFERIPLDLEVEHDKRGYIIISLTLSILPLGTGVIISEKLPNLGGEWLCIVGKKVVGKVIHTDRELKSLEEPFRILDCKTGDRLMFTFNTWNRTVTIEKISILL